MMNIKHALVFWGICFQICFAPQLRASASALFENCSSRNIIISPMREESGIFWAQNSRMSFSLSHNRLGNMYRNIL